MISIKQITDQFKANGSYRTYMKYGNGTVNETYLVTASRELYILRKFNNKLLSDVPAIVSNTIAVANYLKSKDICTLEYIESLDGNFFVIDNDGFYWIMSLYFSGTVTPLNTKNNRMAYQAGKIIGEFHSGLVDFPLEKLSKTVNDSFNLDRKVGLLNKFIEKNKISDNNLEIISSLLEQGRELLSLWNLMETSRFPKRIIHGNARLENILFNTKEEALCLVDFDTISHGNILFDVGSAACSVAGNACADEKYENAIDWKSDFLKEFITGYFQHAGHILSIEERNSLHDAFRLCAFKHILDVLLTFFSSFENGIPAEFEFPTEFKTRFAVFQKISECRAEVLEIIREL